jgi:hypothetical protein
MGGGINIGTLGLNAEYAKEMVGTIQSLDVNQFIFVESSDGKLVYFLWRHETFVQCVIQELKNYEVHNLHITMDGEVTFDGRKL